MFLGNNYSHVLRGHGQHSKPHVHVKYDDFVLPAFKKIANEEAFGTIKIIDGVVTWLGGVVDIAPEGLYARSYEYPVAV